MSPLSKVFMTRNKASKRLHRNNRGRSPWIKANRVKQCRQVLHTSCINNVQYLSALLSSHGVKSGGFALGYSYQVPVRTFQSGINYKTL